MIIKWSIEHEANHECPYNHCIGETPFGRFLITWKGWKSYSDYEVEEAPWPNHSWSYSNTLEELKTICQEQFEEHLSLCL